MPDAERWHERDGARLAAARRVKDHKQHQCVLELQKLGWTGATQPALSRLESGITKRPRPATVLAARTYTDEAGITTEAPEHEAAADQDAESSDDFFRGIAGEPFLGPRQAAAVDAVTHHLSNIVGPMGEHDYAAWADLMRILGLDGQQPPNP